MLICEACGSENPDDVHFCVMCGAFLSKPAPAGTTDQLPAPDAPQPAPQQPLLEPLAPSPPAADVVPDRAPDVPLPTVESAGAPPEAATPPPWFRRSAVATRGASSPPVDLPVLDGAPVTELTPEQYEASTAGLPGLPSGQTGLTARPPQRTPPQRPAPTATTRPQQALAMVLDQSVIDVQPGATASFRVTVRNTGALVEGCSVSVRGIPAAWQRMDPDHFNLDVDDQRDVQVHITPPRSAKTTAGRTALAIVVRSEVNEEIQQRADATLVIEPFFELTTALEPVEIEGKRGGYTYVNVENRGNKSERIAFVGNDPGKRLRFSFRPAELEVRPGQRGSVGVDVRARRRVWGGAEKPRQFSVTANGAEGPPPPPMQGRFGQLPSWPRWVIPVIAAVLAIAIPTTLLLVNRALDKGEASALISVPDLKDFTADAAKQALTQKQLVGNPVNVFRSGNPGVVVGQVPAPGTKLEKGSPVRIEIATDHVAPDVTNIPWNFAKDEVAKEGMHIALAEYVDGPEEQQDKIAWQLPKPGQPAPDGEIKVGVFHTKDLSLLDYRGSDQPSVETALANVGLVVKIIEQGSDQMKGTILGQQPDPGKVVQKGNTVTLIVSSGHPPDPDTTTTAPGASSVPDASPPSS